MAEDHGPDRPRDEADKVYTERLQRADPWIGARKVDLIEDQSGHRAVDEEVVPFDGGPDSARDHGAAGRLMLDLQSDQGRLSSQSCTLLLWFLKPPRRLAR
jgi:hypothetical protein